jgi:DNA-binding SARP family transcriptional activator
VRPGDDMRSNEDVARVVPSPPDAIRLGLMRGFDLARGGISIRLPTSAQRVVALVALHDRPTLRSHVAGMLWGDAPEDRAMGNLRSALWRLRRARIEVIESKGEMLALSHRVILDVRGLADEARRLGDPDAPLSPEFVGGLLVAGDLLPEWFDDWVIVERERMRQLRIHALERACQELAAAGRFGEAIQAGLVAVSEEPLRESAHRVLIAAHLAEGNRAEAIRQFDTYARLMASELQLEPSPQIRRLVEDCRPGPAADRGRTAARSLTRA